jgi:hypothetical protein
MKKILIILGLFFFTANICFAQDDDNDNEKIRQKMSEFIQKRMNLSRAEAERFNPIFMRYFIEWMRTLRENRNEPKLRVQQRIIELRLRYRNEFKDLLGERRCDQVYDHQEIFIQKLRELKDERMRNRPPVRRGKSFP